MNSMTPTPDRAFLVAAVNSHDAALRLAEAVEQAITDHKLWGTQVTLGELRELARAFREAARKG